MVSAPKWGRKCAGMKSDVKFENPSDSNVKLFCPGIKTGQRWRGGVTGFRLVKPEIKIMFHVFQVVSLDFSRDSSNPQGLYREEARNYSQVSEAM